MKFSFVPAFPMSFMPAWFAGSVAGSLVTLAIAAATLTGCAVTPAKEATAARAEMAQTPGEARCWETLNQDHVLICRAEARMRAARRERHVALFDCYDDKVQQMHVVQRASFERSNLLGADASRYSSNPFIHTEPEERKTRLMDLWAQLNACPTGRRDALVSSLSTPASFP